MKKAVANRTLIITGMAVNWVLISIFMIFGLHVISSTYTLEVLPTSNRVALFAISPLLMFFSIFKEFFLKSVWIRIALTIVVFVGLIASFYFLWTHPI